MAATLDDVNRWVKTARNKNCNYIISVCDCFDYEDYPVYCKDLDEVRERYPEFDGVEMQRINEIIKINPDGSTETVLF